MSQGQDFEQEPAEQGLIEREPIEQGDAENATPGEAVAAPTDAADWQPVDLLLGQGSFAEMAAMRERIASDPMLALELADTVAVVEQLRQLRTEPSPEFAGKLAHVIVRADRRISGRDDAYGQRWLPFLVTSIAAVATFAMLWWFDPLGPEGSGGQGGKHRPHAALQLERDDDAERVPITELPPVFSEVAWQDAIETVRQRLALESSPRLSEAFENGLQSAEDPLTQWLDPSNVLMLQRLDHELRARGDVRAAALLRRGSLVAVDHRVQELADGIADDLQARWQQQGELPGRADVGGVVWAMRALIGAGATAERTAALELTGSWLVDMLPELHGEQLVLGVAGVAKLAAVHADDQLFAAAARHGKRLVHEVLLPDNENWSSRRPDLLHPRIAAGIVGEAGRLLERLPAFGVDAERCSLVRHLLLGQLRERRERGQDRPEVLAAMLYGMRDLLGDVERLAIERSLRRWQPVLLAPDFGTVQQLLWGTEPGRQGFARLQRELRKLTVLPIPSSLEERAAFCLCLATNYAGFVGGLQPAR